MKRLPLLLLTLLATVTLTGCDLAEGVLKLGFWSGIIVVVVILAVVWFIARSMRGRGPTT